MKYIILLFSSLMFISGCSISVMDETSFTSTPQFKLRVKNKNCPTNGYEGIRVNDVNHGMTKVRSESIDGYLYEYYKLDSFSLSNSCASSYRYFLYADRENNVGYCDFTRTPRSSETIVNTPGYGNLVWLIPGENIHTGNGSVNFTWPGNVTKNIVLHSLFEDGYIIKSVNLATGNQNANYELVNEPTTVVNLSCGSSLSFSVRWKANTSPPVDIGAIEMVVNKIDQPDEIITVQLRGND